MNRWWYGLWIAVGSCILSGRPAIAEPGPEEAPMPNGLTIRLSDADGNPTAAASPAATTPLSDQEIERLLQRVPPVADGSASEFAIRPASTPRPKTGTNVEIPFPPPGGPEAPTPASGPLHVLRYSPEGEVSVIPNLSVTFSRPMVALTAQEEAAKTVPVELSPDVPGKWRWLGTQTLVFTPSATDDTGPRFPKATRFEVRVPEGTQAADGTPIDKPLVYKFQTPPPSVEYFYPNGGPQPLQPVLALRFDQAIDPRAVLPHLILKGAGKTWPLHLATPEDRASFPWSQGLESSGLPSRVIVVRSTATLPPATAFQLIADAGTPSAEGPRTTPKPLSFSFETYHPFKVTEARCGWNDVCRPSDNWQIEFNNPLGAIDTTKIKIEPSIPGLTIQSWGNYIHFSGEKTGQTTYTVTLPADLPDAFGQTLRKATPLTFKVGPAESALGGPGQEFLVLDPRSPAVFPVWSVNHPQLKVSIHEVKPDQWREWISWRREHSSASQDPHPLPGRKLFSGSVSPKKNPDRLVETGIDLQPYAKDGTHQFLVHVESTTPVKEYWQRQEVLAWVQVTNIGLTAYSDQQDLVVWANQLTDASTPPTEILLYPEQLKVTTDKHGLGRMQLPERNAQGAQWLVARQGDDVAILPQDPSWWADYGSWYRSDPQDRASWFAFNDRGLYRPGETAHVKGWIRNFRPGKSGDISAIRGLHTIQWKFDSVNGENLGAGSIPVSEAGGFDLNLAIPANAHLGNSYLTLSADGHSSSMLYINVQEFRRPEFEVTASSGAGPHLLSGSAIAEVSAKYFAGGGLPGAEVNWSVSSTATSFVPPNRGEYQFGAYVPWWHEWYGGEAYENYQVHSGRTNSRGTHSLKLDFVSMNPPRATSVRAEASVQDVNRQTWTSTTTLLVHPSQWYVGLKTDRAFVDKGQEVKVKAIIVDIDGNEIPTASTSLSFRRGSDTAEACTTVSSGSCRFRPSVGGVYTLTAEVRDPEGRLNQTETQIWVSGAELTPDRQLDSGTVELIPEKRQVLPGEKAKFLVQAPFSPAEGTLTVRRSGLISVQRFHMDGSTTTLSFDVEESHIPNLEFVVDLQSVDKSKLAHATGSITLEVPPASRTLAVALAPDKSILSPGGSTDVVVRVLDPSGRPVPNAEVALIVVDEAVMSLTGYRIPDPVSFFYARRSGDVASVANRPYLWLGRIGAGKPGEVPADGVFGASMDYERNMAGGEAMAMPAVAAPPPEPSKKMAELAIEEQDSGGSSEPVQVRTNFSAVALFEPKGKTNAKGELKLSVKLPDSLTRYRITAVVAAGEKHFGSSESAVTAQLPLMVRPSPPRFLNFGDRAEIPVVIQNPGDRPIQVSVALAGSHVNLGRGQRDGFRLEVPAQDRVEVRFPVSTQSPGKASFQVIAATKTDADSAAFDFPIWTPATTEAFATYGELTNSVTLQGVQAPSDVHTAFGGLTVQTSSTQLQALTDAVLYLQAYPYDCNEQIASRILSIVALKDVLRAFNVPELPSEEELQRSVRQDIEKLLSRQNSDGGFAFWSSGQESWPYLSVHAAHALARAREKGFEVPSQNWDLLLEHLRNIDRHIPKWYSNEAKDAIRAYALLARHRMGDTDGKDARALVQRAGVEKLNVESLGMLLPVLSAVQAPEVPAVLRQLENRATETASTAQFNTSISDGSYVLLHSSRRTDAVILDALIEVSPKHDLIPKVARGLLAHQVKGHWANTQEDTFVLLALDRYFRVHEGVTPDFVSRAWLGDQFVGEHAFKGRTTETSVVRIPMAQVGTEPLTLQADGEGRMYYRLAMDYAPKALDLKAYDAGFTVLRTYEPIDNPSDVKRAPDGSWKVRAGSRIRVRVSMVASARRYHVALVDPLPAGLEAENPDLATTASAPSDPATSDRWWRGTWYEHTNLRDERAEAFTTLLWDGVYEFTYTARATTPGQFIVPPAKAEEMYAPETFGRSASDRMTIE